MRVVLDSRIGEWVASRTKHRSGEGFTNHAGLAVLSSDNRIMAGVVYDEYDPHNKTIQMSVAVDDPKCLTRKTLKNVLSYPFDTLKVYRVWFQTPHTNERLIRIAEIFGFTREAVLKNHFGQSHAAVGRLLYPTYRRIYIDGK